MLPCRGHEDTRHTEVLEHLLLSFTPNALPKTEMSYHQRELADTTSSTSTLDHCGSKVRLIFLSMGFEFQALKLVRFE